MIVSAEEFVYLRQSDDPLEYGRAANEEASVDVWLDVINRYPDMRRWVVHNKTVPLTILELLSTSDDIFLRSAVATKRRLSFELFDMLSNDASLSVRLSVAANAKTPVSILQRLSEDPWEDVAEKARIMLARHGVQSPS